MDGSAASHAECFLTAEDFEPAETLLITIPEANAEELEALEDLEAALPYMDFEQRLSFFDEAPTTSKLGEKSLEAALALADTLQNVLRVLRRAAYYAEVGNSAEKKFTQIFAETPLTFEEALDIWEIIPEGSKLEIPALEKALTLANTVENAFRVRMRATGNPDLQEAALAKATEIFDKTKATLDTKEVFWIFKEAPPGSGLKVSALREFTSDARTEILEATQPDTEA